ncbi:MAG: ABC transporter permease [Desulfobacterales bacterium]|nr:ABC transporter permease [Desulfobacterales bacterium]
MDEITGYIGRKAFKLANHILNLFAFTYRIGMMVFYRLNGGSALLRRLTLEQIYIIGFQALPIIIPVALIIGSLLIIQFAKISGQYDLGKTTVLLIIRELGPGITALLVILRSATAVTVEISYMKALHEIDAIEMTGLDPLRIVCLPRLIGITTAILSLFVVFDLVSIIGGYMIVQMMTQIPLGNFLEQIGKAITVTDIAVGMIKAVCFGFAITVTCLYHAFRTKDRITEIPIVTSKAAIECFFYCLVVNVIISGAFYI